MGRNGFYDGENFLKSMDLLKAMTAVRDNTVLDKTDPASVQQRIEDYFSLCTDCGTRPLVSGFATMLGLRRKELLFVVSGQRNMGYSDEAAEVIKYYYSLLEVSWDHAMNNGGIDKVCGIFLGKNNFGYADQQEIVHVDNRMDGAVLSLEDLSREVANLPPVEKKQLEES